MVFLGATAFVCGKIIYNQYREKHPIEQEVNVREKSVAQVATKSFETLTVEDVVSFVRQRGIRKIAGDKKESFIAWEGSNGLYIRCLWTNNSTNKKITHLYLSNTGVKHGPIGQSIVLQAWNELCPGMEARFKQIFNTRVAVTSRLHWIDKSPYAFGVCQNNKAFVEYVGPQSEIETVKTYAAVTANIRLNWYKHYILASQKRLSKKIKSLTTRQEILKASCLEMERLENQFTTIPSLSGYLLDSWAKKDISSLEYLPMVIPKELPEETRILLYRIASEIAATARLTALVGRGGAVPQSFNPYAAMIMACCRYNDAERSALGKYARIENLGKYLSPAQDEELLKLHSHSLACLMGLINRNK